MSTATARPGAPSLFRRRLPETRPETEVGVATVKPPPDFFWYAMLPTLHRAFDKVDPTAEQRRKFDALLGDLGPGYDKLWAEISSPARDVAAMNEHHAALREQLRRGVMEILTQEQYERFNANLLVEAGKGK